MYGVVFPVRKNSEFNYYVYKISESMEPRLIYYVELN